MIVFAVPFMLSNLFQVLYTLVESGEVANGMEQVNTSTHSNYSAIEHVAAATQENNAGVEEIESMVERIKDLAHKAVEI